MSHRFLSLVPLVIALAGCGGGGGGGSSPAAGLSGKVIDGPISGATVCLDLDSNNACDTGEPSAVTDSTGNYKLPSYSGSIDGLHIIAMVPAGAIDLDTNTAVVTPYVLSAPASNPSHVTPLTTLVSAQMLANPALTAAQAERATLASSNLTGQTTSLLGVDVTTNSGLHKVAQAVAGAIAKTSDALKNNATFTNAAGQSNYGTASSLAGTQAIRLTQTSLLQQMQNSDGSIANSYLISGSVDDSAINVLVTNSVNNMISMVAASTKAGKSSAVDMSAALRDGIYGFSYAGGGSYLDGSNVMQNIGQRHYKFELMSSSSNGGKYRDVGGVWRKSSDPMYDLINGAWVAEYSNAAGTVTSQRNPPTVSGNCFTAQQTPNGINLTACATKVDLASKKLSDFNFDCKDPSGASIAGCNVNATFPAGSVGYNLQVSYDESQYQLYIPVNGNSVSSNMTNFIANYMQGQGNYRVYGGKSGSSDIKMNIASYDSTTKTGVTNWYDNTSGSIGAVGDTAPFTVTTLNGVDVLTVRYPNLYYKLSDSSDSEALFAYAPAGANTNSQAGIYWGWRYASNFTTNIYYGMSDENMMNLTAYNFVAAQYGLPNLP